MKASLELSYCFSTTRFDTVLIGLPAVCHDKVQNVEKVIHGLHIFLDQKQRDLWVFIPQ
jgi:hypothetical protein